MDDITYTNKTLNDIIFSAVKSMITGEDATRFSFYGKYASIKGKDVVYSNRKPSVVVTIDHITNEIEIDGFYNNKEFLINSMASLSFGDTIEGKKFTILMSRIIDEYFLNKKDTLELIKKTMDVIMVK